VTIVASSWIRPTLERYKAQPDEVLAARASRELICGTAGPLWNSCTMRRLGTLPDRDSASLLHDYLYTLGVNTKLDRDGSAWALWVHDEDKLLLAREEFAKFQESPSDPRYAVAVASADTLRNQRVDAEVAARKRQVNLSQKWAGRQTQIPVTVILIVLSIWVAVVTRLGMDENAVSRFLFAEYQFDEQAHRISHDSIWGVFAKRQFYRWLAPIFLHFGPMHLLFNMSATLTFGRAIEQRSGSWRFLGTVLLIGLISNFSQFLMSGPSFGGMSGVDFGLFGFLWMKSRFDPQYGVALGRDYIMQFLFFGALCLFGVFGRIANTAHVSGMFAGMALAMIPLIPRIWRRYASRT